MEKRKILCRNLAKGHLEIVQVIDLTPPPCIVRKGLQAKIIQLFPKKPA